MSQTSSKPPQEYLEEVLNAANSNLRLVVEAAGGEPKIDHLLRLAQVQAELAKAAGLVMVAHAIERTVTPSPGQSLRYGLLGVQEALERIAASQETGKRR